MNKPENCIQIGEDIYNAREIRSINCDDNMCIIRFKTRYHFDLFSLKIVRKNYDVESYKNVKSFYDNLSKKDTVENP